MPPAPPEPPATSRTGDRVATVILLVVSGLVAAALAFAGLFLVFGTDSCGASADCDLDRFTTGWLASMLIPLLGFVGTLIATIVRLGRGRSAFWVPLAGTGAFIAGFIGAVAVAFSGLG